MNSASKVDKSVGLKVRVVIDPKWGLMVVDEHDKRLLMPSPQSKAKIISRAWLCYDMYYMIYRKIINPPHRIPNVGRQCVLNAFKYYVEEKMKLKVIHISGDWHIERLLL